MRTLTAILLVTLMTGCLTRAPSDYELDRRSGLTPPNDTSKRNAAEVSKFSLKSSRSSPSSNDLARTAPRVEKVWVYDQVQGNRVLEGTWMHIEVDKGGWNFSKVKTEPTRVSTPTSTTNRQDRK